MKTNSLTFSIDQYEHRAKESRRLSLQAALLPSQPIWEKSGLTNGMTVLDLGCGPATHTLELAKLYSSCQVIGLDVSEFLLAQAREKAKIAEVANVEFLAADAHSLPLADGSIDFTWARLLIQHVREPQNVLAEAHRVLRPGGRICLVDTDRATFFIHPEPQGWGELVDFLIKRQARGGGDGTAGRKLATRLHEAGFVDVNVEFLGTSWTGKELETIMNDLWLPAMKHSPFPEEMQDDVERTFAEMTAIASMPGAYMHWGWFIATGCRDRMN